MRFFIFSFCILLMLFSFTQKNFDSSYTVYQPSADSLKIAALTVLENNCNECHSKKKPAYYFTTKTMDYFVADINKEVFIKGKMPKGKKNKLTPEDKETLRLWVEQKMKS